MECDNVLTDRGKFQRLIVPVKAHQRQVAHLGRDHHFAEHLRGDAIQRSDRYVEQRQVLSRVWMANLGPSEALFRVVQNAKITWGEFSRPYRKELFEGGIIDRRNRTIKH